MTEMTRVTSTSLHRGADGRGAILASTSRWIEGGIEACSNGMSGLHAVHRCR